jgi:hypothetical protein
MTTSPALRLAAVLVLAVAVGACSSAPAKSEPTSISRNAAIQIAMAKAPASSIPVTLVSAAAGLDRSHPSWQVVLRGEFQESAGVGLLPATMHTYSIELDALTGAELGSVSLP